MFLKSRKSKLEDMIREGVRGDFIWQVVYSFPDRVELVYDRKLPHCSRLGKEGRYRATILIINNDDEIKRFINEFRNTINVPKWKFKDYVECLQ